MTQTLVDNSLFEGMLEFNTESGETLRVENCGSKIVKVFLFDEDSNAFIFEGKYKIMGKFTPANVYRAYEYAQNNQDE